MGGERGGGEDCGEGVEYKLVVHVFVQNHFVEEIENLK